MNIFKKIQNKPDKETETEKYERLKLEKERLKKELIDTLFFVLDNEFYGIPFDIIEKLQQMPKSKAITEKIIYVLNHAYDEDASFYMDAPLWYAIVAETHLDEEFIDPVIRLFTSTDDDWDFLNEQGEYLLGKLAQKYPDLVMKKVTEAIDKIISQKSHFPYLFLFDAFYFADSEKYKDWFLKTLKNPDLYWLDPYAVHIADMQIKEAAPIMKEILEKREIDIITQRELKGAIEQIETEVSEYPEMSVAWCDSRESLKEHYKKFENRFMEKEGDEDDYEELEPLKMQKIGRNEPCPCGSGKKYKKCCGE
jgi:uncharacterized protein YchJ